MRGGRGAIALIAAVVVLGCTSGVVTDEGAASMPPVGSLQIVSPEDGATVTSRSVTVTGSAPDGAEIVRDVSLGLDDRTEATDGRWSMNVELGDGENLLTFRLGDDRTTSSTLRVVYALQASGPSASPRPIGEATPDATATPNPAP